MTIDEAIYTWWTGNGVLCAVAENRLYPETLPQGVAFPAATYRLVSAPGTMAHDGPLDLYKATYQFDCYAETSKAAKVLARTLRQQLNGFRGLMGTVDVHGVFYVTMVSDFGDELDVHRVAIDFRFMYKET